MERKTRVRGNPGKPGRDPVRPYKEAFLEPGGTSLDLLEPCGTSLDHFDHFESMFLCGSLIAHHFVPRTSGTVADFDFGTGAELIFPSIKAVNQYF